MSTAYIAGALALLGTTLTNYCYIWETIEEAEEHPPLRRLGLVKLDASIGIVFAGVIFWFILIGTGATLGAHRQLVQTAADAAQALAPLAGPYAPAIFGLGLLASAAVAVPVLAGTSAYVVADAFGWRAGLDRGFARARHFYVALIASLLLAVAIGYVGVEPVRLLFLSSLAGGLSTPVTLILMMLLARDRQVMDDYRVSGRLAIAGWLVTAVIVLACLAYLWRTIH